MSWGSDISLEGQNTASLSTLIVVHFLSTKLCLEDRKHDLLHQVIGDLAGVMIIWINNYFANPLMALTELIYC